MRPIVLGTAGHIDHGKTSLVRALTGIDTDRLPVEKQRGITTELGFASFVIGERPIAVVDVPGHERFVKSMVAGATGMDLVVLVVAADEGVMPQTREHLEICELLGMQRGVIALTKADLVDEEWLGLASADVRAALAGTFLASAPIVPVSTKANTGLEELRAAITDAIATLPERETTSVFRLPIDRVFTVKGFGTVVTGTVLGGSIAVGDELVVIPTELTTRVRGIEVHGAAVDRASAGQRAAINVHALATDQLDRGNMLVRPSEVGESHILDVELRYLASAPGPLASRAKVLVHHATSQTLATLALVGRESLEPGETAIAQLRLPQGTPIGAVPGDRFIVRGFVATATHGTTIGGGTIVRVLAPKARRGSNHAETVAALATARLDQRVGLDVKAAGPAGFTVEQLVQRTGVTALAEPLARLVEIGEIALHGTHYLHASTLAELERAIIAGAKQRISREELRRTLSPALPMRAFDALVEALVARGAIGIDKDRLGPPDAMATLSPVEQRVLAKLVEGGVEPLRPKELAPALAVPDAQIATAIGRLIAAKLVVRIKPDLVMDAAIVATVESQLRAYFATHATIDAQGWKDVTGASRKFTIPLAEYFDAQKVTLRIGDVRRLR